MKSVPVAVKPPGRRRTGFRCFWVAERKVLLSVCELQAERESDPEGWRPPGARPPRPRAGSSSCCCSGSRHPPRRWPAISRWAADERPSAASFTRRGSAACGRAGGRAGWGRAARGGGGPGCGGSGAPSPAPAWCSAERWRDVGPPRSPQRPNERHRGCGGRRTRLGRRSLHPACGPAASSGNPARSRRHRVSFSLPLHPPPYPPRDKPSFGQQLRPRGGRWRMGSALPGGTVLAFPPGQRLGASFVGEVGSGVGCSSPGVAPWKR